MAWIIPAQLVGGGFINSNTSPTGNRNCAFNTRCDYLSVFSPATPGFHGKSAISIERMLLTHQLR